MSIEAVRWMDLVRDSISHAMRHETEDKSGGDRVVIVSANIVVR